MTIHLVFTIAAPTAKVQQITDGRSAAIVLVLRLSEACLFCP